jgi:hypothetical protein
VTLHWDSGGFANTDLDLQLKRHGIHQVIVMGLIAHTDSWLALVPLHARPLGMTLGLGQGVSCRQLRLLCRTQQHFTDERLRLLRQQHGNDVGHIVRLKHLFRVFAFMRAQVGVHRSRANH